MRKQMANRLGAAHVRDTVQQFVAGEIDRHQAMESLQIGKSQLYELMTSCLAAKAAGKATNGRLYAHETVRSYLDLFYRSFNGFGMPMEIYVDKASFFRKDDAARH